MLSTNQSHYRFQSTFVYHHYRRVSCAATACYRCASYHHLTHLRRPHSTTTLQLHTQLLSYSTPSASLVTLSFRNSCILLARHAMKSKRLASMADSYPRHSWSRRTIYATPSRSDLALALSEIAFYPVSLSPFTLLCCCC